MVLQLLGLSAQLKGIPNASAVIMGITCGATLVRPMSALAQTVMKLLVPNARGMGIASAVAAMMDSI